jgi:hypothetical protein
MSLCHSRAFENVIVRRLQLLRAAQPSRVKIIADNPKHAAEEIALSALEIVGKALCSLKFYCNSFVRRRARRLCKNRNSNPTPSASLLFPAAGSHATSTQRGVDSWIWRH